MPRVPRLNPDGVQAERALPNVQLIADRPDTSRNSAPVFAAINKLGNTAIDMHEQEREKADQQRILEERRALNDWELQNVYDPEKGAVARRGKDAFGLQEELEGNYSKFLQEREKGLSTDTQRASFRQMAESRRESILRWSQGHVGQQIKAVEDSEYMSSLESSKERGTVDPNNLPLERSFIKQQVMTRAQREGWAPEQVAQELRKHDTDLQARYISGLLADKNGVAARDYFEKVKADLDPDAAKKLQPAIDEVFRRGEGQRLSEELVGRYGTGAISKIDSIKDPDLQDEVRQRIKQRISDQEQMKNVAQERTFEQAYNIVAKSRNLDDIAHILPSLSPAQQESLKSYIKKDSTVTDREAYEEIKLGLANPGTRAKYLQMDLNQKRHLLSDSDFQEIVKDKVALMNGDKDTQAKLDGFLTDKETIESMLEDADISKDSDKARMFKEKLDRILIQHQKRTNKKATNDELRSLAKPLLLDVVTKKNRFWFDTTKKAFELQPGDSIEEIEVPQADAELIASELKKRGKPATQEAIVKIYIKGQAKGG